MKKKEQILSHHKLCHILDLCEMLEIFRSILSCIFVVLSPVGCNWKRTTTNVFIKCVNKSYFVLLYVACHYSFFCVYYFFSLRFFFHSHLSPLNAYTPYIENGRAKIRLLNVHITHQHFEFLHCWQSI